MFKLKHLTWSLMLCAALFSTLTFSACSSDDPPEEEEENCTPEFGVSVATGSFMGDAFTMVEGTAAEAPFDADQFRFVLYGETVTGDPCDGFNFDKPKISIIFEVPKEVGTYNFGSLYSLTFNDASVVNEVNADVSVCGGVEIISVNATEVTGRVDANTTGNSDLNGTFTVALCP